MTIATSPVKRLFAKTNFDGPVPEHRPELGPCWAWMGRKNNSLGYGRIGHFDKDFLTHRLSFEYFNGPIDSGLHLDHLCRNPSCCNPSHLEPVTNRENQMRGFSPWAINARKTHCNRGHEFTEANTFAQRTRAEYGGRGCVTCREQYRREYEQRDYVKQKQQEYRDQPDKKEAARLRAAEWYRNNKERAQATNRMNKMKVRHPEKYKALTNDC